MIGTIATCGGIGVCQPCTKKWEVVELLRDLKAVYQQLDKTEQELVRETLNGQSERN